MPLQKNVEYSLDLHGMRRDQAIQEVTRFLHHVSSSCNKQELWVCIITGSGHHSPQGKVLYSEIE